uniref:Uncharacterized protein n=1 Tax=Tanacetum cinerariifolium TaxID=118510 RepID=A0A6L2J5D2_TANCI|nr:hypothetical protein [Tanacetum cinerariifolium]
MNMMTGKGDSSVSSDSPIVHLVAINLNPTPNVVGRSESNMEFKYKAFNTTLTSVKGVADFFGVPFKTHTIPDLGGSPKRFTIINPELGVAEKPKMMSANSFDPVITKPTGASARDQPKVNSNFRPLVVDPVFDGVNISIPRKVVKKDNITSPKSFSALNVEEAEEEEAVENMYDEMTNIFPNTKTGESSSFMAAAG